MAQARKERDARNLQQRVEQSKAQDPKVDPSGKWHTALRDLADECGVPVADVVDDWNYRAAILFYDGQLKWDQAEANAYACVVQFYRSRNRKAG